MKSPYTDLPRKSFWSKTAAVRQPSQIDGFYDPKFKISKADRIATAGSCFAQHVGRALKRSGYNVFDAEPFPPIIPQAIAQKYGFGMYSARYGNIYTIRQLKQLLFEALHCDLPEDRIWEAKGRFFDAQRPNIEPGGFDSPEEVLYHREFHLSRVREVFENLDVLVFTFGLTEAWCTSELKTVFPTAPGTIAGSFDPSRYVFHNFRFSEIREDFEAVRDVLRQKRPEIRFLVTVSPVPLTATATDQHVEVATSRSKATLRAVCAEIFDDYDDVDYYPSYEIITGQASRGSFFSPNLRTVRDEGVATAMQGFIMAQEGESDNISYTNQAQTAELTEDDVVCEEALLEEFARK